MPSLEPYLEEKKTFLIACAEGKWRKGREDAVSNSLGSKNRILGLP